MLSWIFPALRLGGVLTNDSTKPSGHGKSKKARLSRLYSYTNQMAGTVNRANQMAGNVNRANQMAGTFGLYKNKVWRAGLSWIFRARKAWWSHLLRLHQA